MQIADEREAAGRDRNASQRDVQRNNESLANAAIVFTTQESLDAFRLVIEQLSQFYKTSAKVTDSVHSRFDAQNRSGRMDED